MAKEGDRFRDIKTKKVCIVKTVTEDNTVILQCTDGLSETLVRQKDLNRFFESLEG